MTSTRASLRDFGTMGIGVGLVVVIVLAAGAVGCSSGGSGAKTGAAGTTGSAGTPGTAGVTGAAGSAGATGSAGAGGAAGTSTGGAAGTGAGGAGTAGATPDAGPPDAAADKGATGGGGNDAAAGPFALTSTAFAADGSIPDPYTCVSGTGAKPSPPLAWNAGPATTKGYAIVLEDTTNMFTHWAIWDIPAAAMALATNVSPTTHTPDEPAGAKQVAGNNQSMGYIPPCPPSGSHTYVFTLFAQSELPLTGVTTAQTADVIATQLGKHNVATATLSAKVTR